MINFYVVGLTIEIILLFGHLYSEESTKFISSSQNWWPCCHIFTKQVTNVSLRNSWLRDFHNWTGISKRLNSRPWLLNQGAVSSESFDGAFDVGWCYSFKFCLVLAPILCPTGYLNILEHYEMYYGLFMTCLSKIRLKGFVLCVDFYLYIFV